MKRFFFIASGLIIVAAQSSFAAGNVVEKCSNGEETNVKIVQVAPDLYRADVTVQSAGDGYPTFHFKNVKRIPVPSVFDGPRAVYQGQGFEITIATAKPRAPAVLDVPSIGINNDGSLTCR